MKKLFFILFVLMASAQTQAQFFTLGPKGGVKYTGVNTNFSQFEKAALFDQFTRGAQMNFTGGGFARLKIGKLFFQPEVMWSSEQYTVSGNADFTSFKVHHFNVPLLFGLKILKPVNVLAGPVMSKTTALKAKSMDGTWKDITDGEDEKWGYQFGIGLEFGRMLIDLRYEDNLNKLGNEIQLGDNTFRFDERENGVSMTLAYKLFK